MSKTDGVIGRTARVYRNVTRGDYSVSIGGRVVAHVRTVELAGVEFKVYERGRQRVLREKRKNVHAFAIGYVLAINAPRPEGLSARVRYNPYEASTFVDGHARPVHHATRVWLGDGVYADA